MTRFLVTLVLSGSLLSAIGDLLTAIDALRSPGPALASAARMILDLTGSGPASPAEESER
jgi:hypothetical protein